MGRLVDTLEENVIVLQSNHINIVNEEFMMVMFASHINEFPPFKENIEHAHEKKAQHKVRRDSASLVPCTLLRKEVYDPQDASNIETDFMMKELGEIISNTMLGELRDKKKAKSNHLSSTGGLFSWNLCADVEKEMGKGIRANNNVSESSFGGLTEALTKNSMIGLTNAGAMSMVRQNGDFNQTRMHASNKKGINNGKFIFMSCIATNFYS